MYRLVLVRHGESVWNLENKFTGWTDVELSEKGVLEAKKAGKELKNAGFNFKIAFTSELKRAQNTLKNICNEIECTPRVHKSWRLNERHYGALQGLNKKETSEKYGDEQVKIWRRSADVRPPLLEHDDPRYLEELKKYKFIGTKNIPLGECLLDTVKRATPYFKSNILKALEKYQDVIVVAHGNSLRALIMNIEKMDNESIISVEIPTAAPIVYEFDNNLNFINKYFLIKK